MGPFEVSKPACRICSKAIETSEMVLSKSEPGLGDDYYHLDCYDQIRYGQEGQVSPEDVKKIVAHLDNSHQAETWEQQNRIYKDALLQVATNERGNFEAAAIEVAAGALRTAKQFAKWYRGGGNGQ